MQIALFIVFFVLGTAFGSFLCCQARRLRYHETHKKSDRLGSRSVCLHCHYQLKWYDNLPLLSWLALKGKCRKCHKSIGLAEFLSELFTGLAFLGLAVSYNLNLDTPPLVWLEFVLMLTLALLLIFLAIYDGLYGELPSLYLTFSIICAIIIATLREWANFSSLENLYAHLADLLFAVAILGGLYLILYKFSHGKWVGDGDWLLGTSLGLALGTPWLALIALFLANFTACLAALPAIKSRPKIYFGPFLVFAFFITQIFSVFFNSLML